MEKVQQLVRSQEKVKQQQYRLTSHAEQERESDRITRHEIEEAILSHQAKVIESYPEDIRGRSCLVLGFTKNGSPLACGLWTGNRGAYHYHSVPS